MADPISIQALRKRVLWLTAPKIRTCFVIFVISKPLGFTMSVNLCVEILDYLGCPMRSGHFRPAPGYERKCLPKLPFDIRERFHTTDEFWLRDFFCAFIEQNVVEWLRTSKKTDTIKRLFLTLTRQAANRPYSLDAIPPEIQTIAQKELADIISTCMNTRKIAKSIVGAEDDQIKTMFFDFIESDCSREIQIWLYYHG